MLLYFKLVGKEWHWNTKIISTENQHSSNLPRSCLCGRERATSLGAERLGVKLRMSLPLAVFTRFSYSLHFLSRFNVKLDLFRTGIFRKQMF